MILFITQEEREHLFLVNWHFNHVFVVHCTVYQVLSRLVLWSPPLLSGDRSGVCDGWRGETHLYRPLSSPTSDLGSLETSGEDGGRDRDRSQSVVWLQWRLLDNQVRSFSCEGDNQKSTLVQNWMETRLSGRNQMLLINIYGNLQIFNHIKYFQHYKLS